ncbi:hypothetical protein EIN_310000 [Entamoeba invadens IP1]|uniref:UDENN domain-containing protein n=1 Tax=Entamoeba invadens IP1 TaxID=370355 RepID=A0A0A1TWC6_ENTIV|nr:hypothetical protein EIN_310000 [Entamoeba invadens IP1]ELP84967.1 hypothetical protein EIN_310000 [Entamoeba invadens IP1]|eukprot:XP_004184313.1 hypothetical protein EIN_310000 [Entamoeba invadens IP1]
MSRSKATLIKNYKPTDFSHELKQRSMFKQLNQTIHHEDFKLAEQFLIIGGNAEDDTPEVIYKYPDFNIEQFMYEILVEFLYPRGVMKSRKTANSEDELHMFKEKAKNSAKHVSRFSTFFFTSSIVGCTRYAHCLSQARIIQKDGLNYVEDEIFYVMLTLSTRNSVIFSFLEQLLDEPETQNWSTTPSSIHLTDHFKMFFTLPSTYTEKIYLNPQVDALLDIPCHICRCLFLRVIPMDYLVLFVSTLLLEKRLFIKCEHKCLVSSLIAFLVEAIYPFQFEFPIISVLTNSLYDLMDSPTPLIVGLFETPKEIPAESVLYDIDSKTLTFFPPSFKQQIPQFPNANRVVCGLKESTKQIRKQPNHPMSYCIQKHESVISQCLNIIQIELKNMVVEFEDFCISSRTENNRIVSMFMKTEFIEYSSRKGRVFLKEFLQTQMFENWKTKMLIDMDEKKNSSISSDGGEETKTI